MDPGICCVVPNMLRLDLQGEVVSGFLPVLLRVTASVAPAAYFPAHEADPEIFCGVADTTQTGIAGAEGWVVGIVAC